jgi:hypothetical protein
VAVKKQTKKEYKMDSKHTNVRTVESDSEATEETIYYIHKTRYFIAMYSTNKPYEKYKKSMDLIQKQF